ncbi:MAG: 6-O-methylguanine DNA methyltransferase, partial [Actinobacteria bacterium]|nr:6-O-methylguanine DNA methyltransferase [Actinomycetota bacterium]
MEFVTVLDSPVGLLTVSSDGEYLTGLWIAGQKYFAAPLQKAHDAVTANRVTADELSVFVETRAWLDRFFEGEDPGPIPA